MAEIYPLNPRFLNPIGEIVLEPEAQMDTYVLGIESSCDETSAAVVKNGRQVLSLSTARQEEVHLRFGGVVPELASRKHLETLLPVVKNAMHDAGLTYQDLHAIAVTNRPGLVGALVVGLSAAKALAYALRLPLVPINHLEAHLAAVLLDSKTELKFPALGLIISGGHTSLYEIADGFKDFRGIGHTRDDAAGEAFDKGARLLGLPYPGGPELARLAATGRVDAFDFPRAMPGRSTLDFSFSGLKTSLSQMLVKRGGQAPTGQELADICASYQEAIVDALVAKTCIAVKEYHYGDLIVAGGVAANLRLREKLRRALPREVHLHIPEPLLCTDNAAMIAGLGALRWSQGDFLQGADLFALEPSPSTEAKAARGAGART
jgi:N6-L-threonylcarbamoyladenine synthase